LRFTGVSELDWQICHEALVADRGVQPSHRVVDILYRKELRRLEAAHLLQLHPALVAASAAGGWWQPGAPHDVIVGMMAGVEPTAVSRGDTAAAQGLLPRLPHALGGYSPTKSVGPSGVLPSSNAATLGDAFAQHAW